MQTTLIIQDGVQQVVLTPDNKHEKSILGLIESQKVDVAIKVGNFSECRGGWIKHYPSSIYGDSANFDSLMLVLKPKREQDD